MKVLAAISICITASLFANPIRSMVGHKHMSYANNPNGGSLPDGLIQVEYLESTGTQWIDTGIVIDDNDYVITSTFISTAPYPSQGKWSNYFGTYTSESAMSTRLINYSLNDNDIYAGYRRQSSSQNEIYLGRYSISIHDLHIYVLKYMKIEIYNMNGTMEYSQNLYAPSGQPDTSTMVLFGNTNKSRMYSFKISHGNAIVCEMVPCRTYDEDNPTGYMYDIARDMLLENNGSDNFIIGPDVEAKQ